MALKKTRHFLVGFRQAEKKPLAKGFGNFVCKVNKLSLTHHKLATSLSQTLNYFPAFFSWFLSSAEIGKTLWVSKRIWTKKTWSILLLTKNTMCLFQVKIGSSQPAVPASKVFFIWISSAWAILTFSTRNLLPCKIGSPTSIFNNAILGSFHLLRACQVQNHHQYLPL